MPVEMMRCPSCGSDNSVKRTICFSCRQPLSSAPLSHQDVVATGNIEACKHCAHAGLFPPSGQKMSPQQVWCNKEGVAKAGNSPPGKCFQPCFGWSAFEALD